MVVGSPEPRLWERWGSTIQWGEGECQLLATVKRRLSIWERARLYGRGKATYFSGRIAKIHFTLFPHCINNCIHTSSHLQADICPPAVVGTRGGCSVADPVGEGEGRLASPAADRGNGLDAESGVVLF